MKNRKSQIGFSSQRIRYQWMVKVSNLYLAGMKADEAKTAILEYLAQWLAHNGSTARSSRDKAATILLRTWITPDEDLCEFRNDGAELLKSLPVEDRLAVHWGMIMATYPFWGMVADSVGRLLKLQTSIETAQIRRRMKEQYGDRELVSRASRNVVGSFTEWGVLELMNRRGLYSQTRQRLLKEPALVAWVAEASLRSYERDAVPLRELINSPNLFPFAPKKMHADHLVSFSTRLDVLRLGLDDNFILLKNR